MKKETRQPVFPPLFPGTRPVWGQGNNLCSLHYMGEIPLFTFEEEGSEKRKEMEKLYLEEREKGYQQIKSIYEANCFVGTVFCGGNRNSAKITKIHIDEERAYICYKASDEHIAEVEEMNKTSLIKLKPIKSGKFSLHAFLSGINSKTVTILHTPIK